MSVEAPTNPKTIPLYFYPHQELEDINYMRHTLKEWDIGKLKLPIYFYQPSVKPNSEGGVVKDDYAATRKKREFYSVNKEYIKKPEEETWMMYSSDGVTFKGFPDTLTSKAIIYPDRERFRIQIANNSIRINDGKELDGSIDIDTYEKRKKADDEAKQREFKKNFKFISDAIEKKEKERKNLAKQLKMEGDEDIAIGGSDSGDNDEEAYNLDENAADVEDFKSDDDDILEEDIDKFLEPPDELLQMSDNENEEEDANSDDDSVDEDGNPKKKKKSKKDQKPQEQAEAAPGDAQGQTKIQSTEKIVDDLLGPKVIKEDELVRYMMDVGLATLKQIWEKFKDRLKTPEQKDALKKLIIKNLQQDRDNDKGIKYLKLKERK